MRHPASILAAAAATLAATAAGAAQCSSFGLDVLVDGAVRPEYRGRGSTYVEAMRGKEYVLRIINPLGVRVAVALAVDGLNTIDARRSEARNAAKWVLAPYETVEISGWQVSGKEARAFYFTGEKGSYGAWLGETANLGVIEAVFFRERPRPVPVLQNLDLGSAGAERSQAPAPPASGRLEAKSADSPALDDGMAATGIGDRRRHEVEWVSLELERDPAAVVRVRYEFREQLVKLGLLPPPRLLSPLERREGASGFSGGYCPQPPGL
jgi:hypothetical protein